MAGLLPLYLLLLTSISTVRSSDPDTALRRTLESLGIASERPCRLPGVACSPSSLHATRIRLPSHRLQGSVSASVGLLSELRELSLPGNLLSGPLPSEISACRSLEVLNLRANRLSGPVPRSLSSLASLRALDLSSNHFVGDLSFLVNLSNLVNLSLSNNFFSGRVPFSLSSSWNLAFLDLSGNPDLYGIGTVLPKQRYILEESKNDPSSSSSSIAVAPAPGHHYYTYSAGSPAPAPAPMPPSALHHRSSSSRKIRNWILGFVTGVIAGALSGVAISLVFRMLTNCIRGRYKNYGVGPAIFSPTIIKNAEDLAFLEKDDVVASLEVVGRGGCGEVYRAPLPNNTGMIIAIKKIMKRSADGAEPGEDESRLLDKWMRQIRSEIVTVGRIRHRNLLPLLAHVTRPDCHFLVYEFMKNGSLHDAMKRSSSEGVVELDWLLRHKIAVGVAAGLEYLHVHHKPHIIHRDLKPANILLDDHMEARIADFGLAKEVPDGNTHMTGSNVAGTCGYIAPEYHQTLKFTTKCDMYSFGVILAALVIGKFPSDDFFQDTDEMNLVKWLRNVMNSEDPAAAIDPKLKGNGYEEQMLLVLKIACFCTMDDPRERPSSKEVRVMLSQIVH
ncbi:leucine-rich repeat receptor-like serine/threonine/tyrosine-protein kinase SOBIR1 [Iris pallida]|uniref:Leucine-rich repeat receptor-like serine/threonine/tyrosine-protein kinase SOBIR1 n=1 Tax=Iris pallida TaxID=29817 RepID=A0AAX6HXU5_IRIPA|nr:leucine-rich repeat receptor-like serine/threonine/tyrosine-protein kinase SOBIR1 [Iris pallida]